MDPQSVYDTLPVLLAATPSQHRSKEGRGTCGAGATRVGAKCVVALHRRVLWTWGIREAAFIYISAAGGAARRGHPASGTDTVVLGLPQQTAHYIFKTGRRTAKKRAKVRFIKCLLNCTREISVSNLKSAWLYANCSVTYIIRRDDIKLQIYIFINNNFLSSKLY